MFAFGVHAQLIPNLHDIILLNVLSLLYPKTLGDGFSQFKSLLGVTLPSHRSWVLILS